MIKSFVLITCTLQEAPRGKVDKTREVIKVVLKRFGLKKATRES